MNAFSAGKRRHHRAPRIELLPKGYTPLPLISALRTTLRWPPESLVASAPIKRPETVAQEAGEREREVRLFVGGKREASMLLAERRGRSRQARTSGRQPAHHWLVKQPSEQGRDLEGLMLATQLDTWLNASFGSPLRPNRGCIVPSIGRSSGTR